MTGSEQHGSLPHLPSVPHIGPSFPLLGASELRAFSRHKSPKRTLSGGVWSPEAMVLVGFFSLASPAPASLLSDAKEKPEIQKHFLLLAAPACIPPRPHRSCCNWTQAKMFSLRLIKAPGCSQHPLP